jgi:hypothetical protein
MIIRRATQVVAWSTMPRSVTQWRPKASPEGPREAGIGQWWAPRREITYPLGRASRYGVASSFGRHCSALAVAPDFTVTRMGRGFAGGLPCQAPSEGGQPFASSPFAHPIPQSRRRASGDLFSGPLTADHPLQLTSTAHTAGSICVLHRRISPPRLLY